MHDAALQAQLRLAFVGIRMTTLHSLGHTNVMGYPLRPL